MSDRYVPRTAMFPTPTLDRPKMTPDVAHELGYDAPSGRVVDKESKDQTTDVLAEYPHETLADALTACGRTSPVGAYDYTLGRYTA